VEGNEGQEATEGKEHATGDRGGEERADLSSLSLPSTAVLLHEADHQALWDCVGGERAVRDRKIAALRRMAGIVVPGRGAGISAAAVGSGGAVVETSAETAAVAAGGGGRDSGLGGGGGVKEVGGENDADEDEDGRPRQMDPDTRERLVVWLREDAELGGGNIG
jgi:hypothetical protein